MLTLRAATTSQCIAGKSVRSNATLLDRCPFRLSIRSSAFCTLPCRLAAAPSTPWSIAANRSNSFAAMPPLSCISSSDDMAPSSHSLMSCSTYDVNRPNARARLPACCRVPYMPNTARRKNRSSPASWLMNARRSTCRCLSTFTVVETSVARAMDITGTTTPMIVGRNRLFANAVPSAEFKFTTPTTFRNFERHMLISPQSTNANTPGSNAARRK
mmetsp:Transcript_34198/g.82684  ORF Transcript_34198/g.82684 Transcript_34198/m.82684 type:complete len:215 (+) Transcript_34198:921-1565(+)